MTARTGEPHIKTYVEEREISVLLAVDCSGSLRFGTRLRFKSELVAEVAATLALSAARNNDRAGLLAFTDQVESSMPARKGRRHALRLVREILTLAPRGRGADFAAALRHARGVLPARSILFLFSDFAGVPGDPAAERALAAAAVRFDVVPVVISDPADVELPNVGVARILDPETGRAVTVNTGNLSVREHFRESWEQERLAVSRLFGAHGLDAIHLRTDEPYASALIGFFRRRERRIGR